MVNAETLLAMHDVPRIDTRGRVREPEVGMAQHNDDGREQQRPPIRIDEGQFRPIHRVLPGADR